ncbi:MAG: hypothetical protein N2482_01045 [Patescibacteria group bacterium]|nr:hypothetical protein [Patescibacteria group bacterium]
MKKLVFIIFILLLVIIFYFLKNKKTDLKTLPKVLENKSDFLIKKENYQSEENTFQNINQGLALEIIEPKNNTVVSDQSLTIKGRTSPKVEVFINEKELISDEKGNFEAVLTLDEGENSINVVASDNKGNYAEKEVIVILETVN